MRRPLCAFCLSALGVLVLRSFLPQMGLLLPSAAIFVVFCLLVWWKGGAARGYAVCLLLGAVLGVGIMEMTGARLAKIQDAYAGKEVTLTAEVESTGRAYTTGRVSAVLMVEKVDGEAFFAVRFSYLNSVADSRRLSFFSNGGLHFTENRGIKLVQPLIYLHRRETEP